MDGYSRALRDSGSRSLSWITCIEGEAWIGHDFFFPSFLSLFSTTTTTTTTTLIARRERRKEKRKEGKIRGSRETEKIVIDEHHRHRHHQEAMTTDVARSIRDRFTRLRSLPPPLAFRETLVPLPLLVPRYSILVVNVDI